MKKAGNAAAVIFFLLPCAVFGMAKKEEVKPVNDTWTICVTQFDTSKLPADQKAMGDNIVRRIVDSLNGVEYRLRSYPESKWYGDAAWSRTRTAAAKAIETKRSARDLLLYKGDPAWKYKQNVKAIDKELKVLEKTYQDGLAVYPEVSEKPLFVFAEGNKNGSFPQPPAGGGEYKFCRSQKADGFLAGEVTLFHGRVFISVRFYAMYSRSYLWQDSILFSIDDQDEAIAGIGRGLVEAVVGGKPAKLAIKAEPREAVITVDNRFAGTGGAELSDIPPGKAVVTISAPEHEEVVEEVDLGAGGMVKINAELAPLGMTSLRLEVPGYPGASLYKGALYLGSAPLTVTLPLRLSAYLRAETTDGRKAPAAVPVGNGFDVFTGADHTKPVRRTAFDDGALVFSPKLFPSHEEHKVDKARRRYYWSWAGSWAAMSAAWLLYGTYSNTYMPAFREIAQRPAGNYSAYVDMYNKTNRLFYLSWAGIGITAAAFITEAFMIGNYIYTAERDAPVKVNDFGF